MALLILEFLSLLFAGVLAGEEFIVRYGVQPALSRLEDSAHIQARHALIRRMRVVVPVLMIPTVILSILVLIFGGPGAGLAFRIAGVAALVAFVLFSFLGTVPINIRVFEWDVANPPADWKTVIRRWERVDVFRSSAALLGFALLLVAVAVQLRG